MTSLAASRTQHPVRGALGSVRAAPYRAAAIALAALVADRAFDPDRTHVPFCPLHALTGIWCPFCGGLRAASQLTRFHFRAALHDNVLFVASLPVLLALWLDWALRARQSHGRRLVPRAAVVAIVALALIFTVLRNLPGGAALRPGG
jgi:Protein of unknown function (DUF2752)